MPKGPRKVVAPLALDNFGKLYSHTWQSRLEWDVPRKKLVANPISRKLITYLISILVLTNLLYHTCLFLICAQIYGTVSLTFSELTLLILIFVSVAFAFGLEVMFLLVGERFAYAVNVMMNLQRKLCKLCMGIIVRYTVCTL